MQSIGANGDDGGSCSSFSSRVRLLILLMRADAPKVMSKCYAAVQFKQFSLNSFPCYVNSDDDKIIR